MKIIRRIILFLAIILSVLWIEAAHADMSAPELRQFEVVVINPDGVDYYDYKEVLAGHLNKNDIAIIMYEYNGEYTLGSSESDKYGNHEILGYVKSLDGFSIVQDEVDPTKITDDNTIIKYETAQKARVNNADGVDMYAGPSSVYEKVGHIDDKTTLTYKYSTEGTHIYVEYNGKKGWVEILNGKVLVQNEAQYIFKDDITTECGTIPRNTITTPTYRTDKWTHESVFEYNGCEFIYNTFRDEKVFSIYPYTEKIIVDLPLYEYADSTSTLLGTVPAGTKLTVLASKDTFGDQEYVIYAKYNDIKGWAVGSGEIFDYSTFTESDEKVEDSIKPTEEPETPAEPKVDVKKGISLQELIILCSMGGVLLIVTAVAVVILINKTKNNKDISNEQK